MFNLFLLFGFITFFYIKDVIVGEGIIKLLLPYLAGAISGVLVGLSGYKYPKVIHLTLFALPLMLVGS